MEGAFGHIARMIGNGRVSPSGGIEPDLVTAGCLSIKLKPKGFQSLNDFTIPESAQLSHQALTMRG